MFKPNKLVLATAMAFGATSAASTVLAGVLTFDPNVAYSATRIIAGAEQRIEQRYFQQNATTQRMETHLHGQQSTIIIDAQRGVMIMLMPGQNMYVETSIEGRTLDGMNVELPDPGTWVSERVGRETVNGEPATRYRVASEAGAGARMQGHVWVSDHGIPVRTDMETGGDRIHMELRDLVVGPQPAALFQPPASYRRMTFNEGLPGQQSGARGATEPSAHHDEPAAAPGFIDELSKEATEEARRATKDEVRGTVSDTVRKGLRGILRGG